MSNTNINTDNSNVDNSSNVISPNPNTDSGIGNIPTENPWLSDSYWKQYFDSLTKETTEKVRRIAVSGVYEFEYIEGPKKGEKIRLQRGKISVRQMRELEEMRARYAKLTAETSTREQAAMMVIDIYAKCALFYFSLSESDFTSMDWDTAKINCDAAVHISTYGRPK